MLAEFPHPPCVPRLRSPLPFAQANEKAHPYGQAFSFAWWWMVDHLPTRCLHPRSHSPTAPHCAEVTTFA
jgi:hypothetical protein